MNATHPYPRRWQALGVLALSLLVICIDNTILNVALPSIRGDLDANASESQWIVDSYLLLFAGLLLVGGTLGDRFGRRKALLAGLAIFGTGSLLAGLSHSAHQLIACRALMGVGSAAIMPATLSIITNIFPADERPRAIAAWAGVSGLGVALGPIAGGALIEQFDWSSVFFVNLPIVVVALVAGAILIPDSRDPAKPRLDLVGAGLSTAGLSAIVWGLIEASDRGWTALSILGAFGAGAAVLAAFFAWELRAEHAMLDVAIFRNMRFSAASASVTFVFFALMGSSFVLTSYLQTVMGFSALGAGVRMLPLAFGLGFGARISVRLVAAVGTKIIVASGLAIVASSLAMLTAATVDSGYGLVAASEALMGLGMGICMAPGTDAIMGSLPPERAGVGSAVNDVVREVGGALGVAVIGSVLTSTYSPAMDDATRGLPAHAAGAAADSVGAAHQVATALGGDAGVRLIGAADQAFVHAMSTTMSIAAAVALAGALIALRFLPARPQPVAAVAEPVAA
ncbi:MAG TPA: MFS transporter [Baekduia sp.]|nr:MFS transporter [Baekduia sp.]